MQRLPLGWITPLGTRIYRLVSNHLRRAWQLLHALRAKHIPIGWRLQQAAAATPIVLMLASAWLTNMVQASSPFLQATAPLANRLKHFGLQQRWIVFSQMPLQADGWLEVHLSSSTAPPATAVSAHAHALQRH